jgi:hypothetical protein
MAQADPVDMMIIIRKRKRERERERERECEIRYEPCVSMGGSRDGMTKDLPSKVY